MNSFAAIQRRSGASDDRAGAPNRPVDDVVVGGEEVAEDAGDAGFGFSGELDFDRRPPTLPVRISGEDDAVGEMEGPATLAFAEFPLAEPGDPRHGFGFGADQADGMAVGDGGQGGFVGVPGEAGAGRAVGGITVLLAAADPTLWSAPGTPCGRGPEIR